MTTKTPSKRLISAESVAVMDNVFSDLQSFNPYRIGPLKIIVPMVNSIGLTEYDQLDEMESICGVDRELWHTDGNYYVLIHP